MSIYNYRTECDIIKKRFEKDLIDKEEAIAQLHKVEKEAYENNPQAEPDGDITYCVATTVEEIRRMDN